MLASLASSVVEAILGEEGHLIRHRHLFESGCLLDHLQYTYTNSEATSARLGIGNGVGGYSFRLIKCELFILLQ